MRKVYLERDEFSKEFSGINIYSAWKGFWDLGYECESYTWDQMDSLSLTKDTIVCGYIRSVRKALRLLDCPSPVENSIPEELKEFTGRKIWESTLAEIRKYPPPVFLKPLETQKLFTGHVRGPEFKDLLRTCYCPDDTKILASEPVTFVSEYRGFVWEGKLVGWKHYAGDFRKMPDVSVVEAAIKQYKTSPIAYSIDFGLDIDNRSLLVEVNDAFALGSYGLESTLYAKMIEARWDEMVGNK